MHQLRLNLFFDMNVLEFLLRPFLTLLLQMVYTMPPCPICCRQNMFQSSSRENISPITPRPYQPGCNMSFERWQRSEDNRIKALSIRKSKCLDQVCPAFGSSYAANISSAAIDHEVQRQLELARRSAMEQEIKHRVQHEMQMASFYAAMPYHSPADECEKKDEIIWDDIHVSGVGTADATLGATGEKKHASGLY